jgi:hypothetical protein
MAAAVVVAIAGVAVAAVDSVDKTVETSSKNHSKKPLFFREKRLLTTF